MKKETIKKVCVKNAKKVCKDCVPVPMPKTGLDFRQAFIMLRMGYAVRRAEWLGYWIANGDDIFMHSKDGDIIYMKDGCIPMFTLKNTLAHDWMIVDADHRAELDKIHAARILMPAANQQKASKILANRRSN